MNMTALVYDFKLGFVEIVILVRALVQDHLVVNQESLWLEVNQFPDIICRALDTTPVVFLQQWALPIAFKYHVVVNCQYPDRNELSGLYNCDMLTGIHMRFSVFSRYKVIRRIAKYCQWGNEPSISEKVERSLSYLLLINEDISSIIGNGGESIFENVNAII